MSDYPILDDSTHHENGEFTHNPCGAKIMTATVYRSVHDGPSPLSGGGEVDIELVPYCPTCEEKPGAHGAPVHQRQVDVDEAAILRQMRE